jgi:hypothetical protein
MLRCLSSTPHSKFVCYPDDERPASLTATWSAEARSLPCDKPVEMAETTYDDGLWCLHMN